MEVGKSIVFKIDSELWARFKSKIAHEDARIGNLIKHWIKDYTDPPKRETPKKEVPVKSDKAISRPNKQARKELETAPREPEETGEPELVSLEQAGIDYGDVEAFSRHLKSTSPARRKRRRLSSSWTAFLRTTRATTRN